VKVETTVNEIVLEGDEKFTINNLRRLLREFIQKAGIKGKVKKGKEGRPSPFSKAGVNPYFAAKMDYGRLSLNSAYKRAKKLCFSPWAT
jgi:hypothetical protein